MRLYDRLFSVPYPGSRNPHGERVDGPLPGAPAGHAAVVAGEEDEEGDAGGRSYLDDLNPSSKRVIVAYVEPLLAGAPAESRFQFERVGYFVADRLEHAPGRPVFNRTVTLKDSWKPGGAR